MMFPISHPVFSRSRHFEISQLRNLALSDLSVRSFLSGNLTISQGVFYEKFS